MLFKGCCFNYAENRLKNHQPKKRGTGARKITKSQLQNQFKVGKRWRAVTLIKTLSLIVYTKLVSGLFNWSNPICLLYSPSAARSAENRHSARGNHKLNKRWCRPSEEKSSSKEDGITFFWSTSKVNRRKPENNKIDSFRHIPYYDYDTE